MDKKYRLTAQTLSALEQELQNLQTIRWREIEEMLEDAKLYGDLSENAEYHAAKAEQETCIRRISEIGNILSHAVVTDAEGREHPCHFSPSPAPEEAPFPASGQCGENLSWELREETLFISGTGPMENYNTSVRGAWKPAPWRDMGQRALFRHIVIEEGVTTIGSHAFANVTVEDIIIPDSVKVIESWAFADAEIDRLELRDTLETLKPNIIAADPCSIGTLILSVNIPCIEWEAFYTRFRGPKEIWLTGTLPDDLGYLVYSRLFVFRASCIRYPGEWDTGGETFYEKLSQALLNAGGFNSLPAYTSEDLGMLKQRLIPMD